MLLRLVAGQKITPRPRRPRSSAIDPLDRAV